MKLAVVGTGYWGSKIVSTLHTMGHEVEQLDLGDELKKINAGHVIVATPANTHFDITKTLLQQNKNVLVEKPAFKNMQECLQIEKNLKTKFMAGHILLYSEHFRYIKEHLGYYHGKIRHIESRRLNWGRAQEDISPVLHLAPHDIAVIDALTNQMPDSVYCHPYHISRKAQPDYVCIDMMYEGTTVQIQTGWHYNEKIRNIKVFTDKGIFDWKDERNETNYFANGDPRHDENFSEYETSLTHQLQAFIDYCDKDVEPVSNYAHTKRVTYIVECIENSLNKGEVIKCSKKY